MEVKRQEIKNQLSTRLGTLRSVVCRRAPASFLSILRWPMVEETTFEKKS
jgi:hypothetical protein